MKIGKGCRLFAAVLLLVPALALATGARHMPRLEAPGDRALAEPGESVLIDVLANDGVLGDGLVLVKVNPPLRGSAVIDGEKILYTAASDEGHDRFGYMVRLADGRSALGVVDVQVKSLPTGLVMKGLVPAHVGAGATVRLRLGADVVHETLTRAGGHFTVVAPGDTQALDKLMSVEVVGVTGAGVPARWHSVLGTSGDFAWGGWWGRDGEDHWNLRVGPFSTAHHALLSRVVALPGGSTQDYLDHLPSVDPLMMLRLATVFAMVAEGEVALPAGKPDAYALITDLGALDALVESLPAGVFEARQAETLADRRLIQHYGNEPTDLGAYGAMLPPSGAGLVLGSSSSVAELRNTLYTVELPRPTDWVQMEPDEGWLRLVMQDGVEQADVQRLVQCSSGSLWPYRVTRHWNEETLVGLFSGDDLAYLLRLRDVTEVTQPESFPGGCLPEIPAPVVVAERIPALLYHWWLSHARREGFEPGKHHLSAATSASDRTPRSGWLDVDDQAVDFDGRSLFQPLLWSNGWSLAYDLEDQSGLRMDHSAKLMRQSAGAQEWLVTVTTSENFGYSVFTTPGVNADPELGVVDFNGVWMNGPTVSDLSMGRPGVNEFLMGLDVAAGTGQQIRRLSDGAVELEPVWLEVGDTTLSAFSFRTSAGELVGQCPPGDSGCTPWRHRDWQVLRVLHDHFGLGHHLMWIDERLRLGFVNGHWAADVRRVMPYMLTGDPMPNAAAETTGTLRPLHLDFDEHRLGGNDGMHH